MTTLAFTAVPPQAPHYLRALLSRKRAFRAGQALPSLEATLTLAPEAAALAAYRRLCGFSGSGVPITFPHVLASPLHLALITDPAFPLPAMGLLHVANRIVQHRALREDERLSLRVAVAGQRDAKRGLEFDLRSEVKAAGELVWESASTLLHRLPSEASGHPKAVAPPAAPPPPARSETWDLPADLGRSYARISGDYNPIHLWPLTARLFGFRRPIVHGMWTLARSAAALGTAAPPFPSALEVRFKRPLALPGTAVLGVTDVEGGQAFRVADRAGSETFLEGSWIAARP